MLHFYHHPDSPYSRKVFFLLEEAKRPFDLQFVRLENGDHKRRNFLDVNPAGRVPTIKDGDFAMGESNAIMRYLARKFGLHSLYPIGLQEQAYVDLWWEFCTHHINRPLLDLAWNCFLYKKYHGKSDERVVEKATKNLERDLPILDRHLAERNYLAGPNLTLADINLLPFAVYCHQVVHLDNYSSLRAWIDRVSARESWKTVVAYSGL